MLGHLIGELRYALRQFWVARVFTITAVLTLALGIGGTTAIFTLIHAVMLRSLPVGDPSRLYRIGDGDNCCVQGGPQDRWGMFSFPLFERLKAELPEFEMLTAFQAGARASAAVRATRRRRRAAAARSLVTGNYFPTLGVGAFAGRVFTAADDAPAAAPVVVMSHHAWQSAYGGDPSVVGATLGHRGAAIHGRRRDAAGFFGETLRGDPPDLWIPLQQEPLINGATLDAPPADVGVAARDRPAAAGRDHRRHGRAAHRACSASGCSTTSGYPPNWMPDVDPGSAAAGDRGRAGGRRRRRHEGAVRPQPADPAWRVRSWCCCIACANVANLLLARAVARRGQTALRLAIGASRRQIVTQALVESVLLAVAGGIVGLVVAIGTARLLLSLAFAGRELRADQYLSRSRWSWHSRSRWRWSPGIVFGAAPAWFATRTDPIDALRGAGARHERSFLGHAQGAARRAGNGCGRSRRRLDDAGAQPGQSAESGLWLRDRKAACWWR